MGRLKESGIENAFTEDGDAGDGGEMDEDDEGDLMDGEGMDLGEDLGE